MSSAASTALGLPVNPLVYSCARVLQVLGFVLGT